MKKFFFSPLSMVEQETQVNIPIKEKSPDQHYTSSISDVVRTGNHEVDRIETQTSSSLEDNGGYTASSRTLEDRIIEPETLETLKLKRSGLMIDPTIAMVPESDLEQQFEVPITYDLSIVTPTRNERDNVEPLLRILKDTLTGIRVEVIFVDDSDDDTPAVVKHTQQTLATPEFRVRLEHRVKGPERVGGLATAVTSGLKLAQARYVAVLDADLQHPPALLRDFYEQAVKQNVDLVLASRYIKGGSSGGLAGFNRHLFSVGLKWTAKILFPTQLATVSDPLGGFFLLRRSLLDDAVLRPIGYKILLEILIRCRWEGLVEIPYVFQQREHGQSKADLGQGITALRHMARLFKEVPAAGRIWKIIALILLNVVVLSGLFFLYPYAVTVWYSLSIIVFGVLALTNFFIFNRAIFPPRSTGDSSSTTTIDQELTGAMPVVPNAASKQVEKVFPQAVSTTSTAYEQTTAQALALLEQNKKQTLQAKNTSSIKGNRLKVISVALVLITLACVSYTSFGFLRYALPNAWVIIAAVFFGLSITVTISQQKVNFHQVITMLLAIAVGLSFVDYVSWRFEVTNWAGWWIAVPLLFAETLGAVHTLGLQFTLWPRSQLRLQRTEDPTQFPIFIFIPTVNEGVTILEPTLQGIIQAKRRYQEHYPHAQVRIVLCNDGYVANAADWQEAEYLAQRMGVECVTRTTPGGAKAGNIENARQQVGATGNALIVIFDADQVAKEDFLVKTTPSFADPKVGWVQTGQYYRNLENPVTLWADDQQSMFYNLLCPGKATWNAAFICGTNVVIRAHALDEIGGLPQDSVTEDFAASISLHTRWKSIYLTDVLATGLGPMDMNSYLKQQRRWAIGTLSVLRTHWRDILLPKKNGLSIGQRIQYFLACTHYLCGVRDLIYLICPLLFIFTGVPAVHGSTLDAFFWNFLPYFLASAVTIWYVGRGITGLRGIILGFGSFPVLVESLLVAISGRKVAFTVTSKKRGKSSSTHLWIYLISVVACIVGLAFGLHANPKERVSMYISMIWVVYSLLMLGSFLWLCYKDWREHKVVHAVKASSALEQYDYPKRYPVREQGLQSALNLGIALILAASIFVTGIFHANNPPAQAYSLNNTNQPYMGVALPETMLKQKPVQLEQQLHTQFGIIGRTQSVGDQFDTAWANTLSAQNEEPWVTLEFGALQANGKPNTDASLLSIANGLHDTDLKRWAQSIEAYNKPVYITILLHVDRNWALSSAVANGGIPVDAARAWLHVESVFKQQGANNVFWVWSPADPAHDQPYAPPAGSINAVLLSLISYPGTKWADPQTALNAVVHRYPNKPILLEVSADGPSAHKAAWLKTVGTAVTKTQTVYALIYDDASPDLKRNAVQDKHWSMLSDPDTLNTMRQIAAQLKKH